MNNRLPDHALMFAAAKHELSIRHISSPTNTSHSFRGVPTELLANASLGRVSTEATSATDGAGSNPTGVELSVKSMMMKPSDYTNVPDWEQIVGNHQAKTSLWATIDREGFEHVYAQRDSILLFGPPGTGKTSMIKSLARRAGFACLEVQSEMIKKKYFGESET